MVSRARKVKGFTRDDLAARALVSPQTIATLEKGGVGVSLATLVNAMEILGLLGHLEKIRDPATDAMIGDVLPARVRRPMKPTNPDF